MGRSLGPIVKIEGKPIPEWLQEQAARQAMQCEVSAREQILRQCAMNVAPRAPVPDVVICGVRYRDGRKVDPT